MKINIEIDVEPHMIQEFVNKLNQAVPDELKVTAKELLEDEEFLHFLSSKIEGSDTFIQGMKSKLKHHFSKITVEDLKALAERG